MGMIGALDGSFAFLIPIPNLDLDALVDRSVKHVQTDFS